MEVRGGLESLRRQLERELVSRGVVMVGRGESGGDVPFGAVED